MGQELERYDLRTLLELYMQESKAFSAALSGGATWQELRDRRVRIKKINECINQKYNADHPTGRRRDDLPPHGD
jgi:hypothetical protein